MFRNVNSIKIYLAGTIYTEEPHSSWKENILEYCNSNKIENVTLIDPNPMRGTTSNEVIRRDKSIIRDCDIILAYYAKCTIGTTMEIQYAHENTNTCVCVIDPNNEFRNDIWLRGHTDLFFDNPIQAIDHLVTSINTVKTWNYRI